MIPGQTLNGYTIVRLIGEGCYGSVYQVNQYGQTFALKRMGIIQRTNNVIYEPLTLSKSEVEALKCLSHKFLVRYVDRFMDPTCQTYVVSEFVDGKNFKTLIQEKRDTKEAFHEIEIRAWIIHLLLALVHVHEKNIIHRELKPNNIYLTAEGFAKLADFGLVKVLRPEVSVAVTLTRSETNYRAPEMWQGRPYRNKVDIWALGCFLYELMYLQPAFSAEGGECALIERITQGQYGMSNMENEQFSRPMKDLLKMLLTVDASLRPSALYVLNLPYLRNEVDEICEIYHVRNPTLDLCEAIEEQFDDEFVSLTSDEHGNFPSFSWPVRSPASESQCTWKDMLTYGEGTLAFPRLNVTLPGTGEQIGVLLRLVRRPPDVRNPPLGEADLSLVAPVIFKKDMRIFVVSEGAVDPSCSLYLLFQLKICFPRPNNTPYVFYRDDLGVCVSTEVENLVTVENFLWEDLHPNQPPSAEVKITVHED